MARFERMLSPWLGRLERLVKPRLPLLLDHRVAGMLSGLLLVLLGLLLALPIPFTNYIFGSLLLLFALALLERDGALMIVACSPARSRSRYSGSSAAPWPPRQRSGSIGCSESALRRMSRAKRNPSPRAA